MGSTTRAVFGIAIFVALLVGGFAFMWLVAVGCAVGGDATSRAPWLCDPKTGSETLGWWIATIWPAAAYAGAALTGWGRNHPGAAATFVGGIGVIWYGVVWSIVA